MLKQIIIFLFLPFATFASGLDDTMALLNAAKPMDTHCATNALLEGLTNNESMIDENDSETNVKMWVYDVFQSPDVLNDVLACPEIIDAEDTETIRFMPIRYKFSNGRELTINYETQPKVLEQRLLLASKTQLPTDEISPAVSGTDPHAVWVNVDPAWYGIMVVQSGALDDFVGPDHNNTISMKYIEQNIAKFYPQDMDGVCTTRAGMGARSENSMVHNVIHEKTAKHEDDDNNYYIAGDINLSWISYAEAAFDVVMMVVSWGGTAALKGARLAKLSAKLGKNMRVLLKAANVERYVQKAAQINKAKRTIEGADKFAKSMKNVSKLEKSLAKATEGTKKYKKIEKQLEAARKIHANNALKLGKDADNIKTIKDLDKLDDLKKLRSDEISKVEKEMKNLAKNDKNVQEYIKQSDALKDIHKYANELKSIKKARTGNVFKRTWQGLKNARKTFRAANRGGKALDKAQKTARKGAAFIDKMGDVSKMGKNVTKMEKDLNKAMRGTDKILDATKDLERAAQSHLDELTRLNPDKLDDISKVDINNMNKLLDTERESIAALNKSGKEIEAMENSMKNLDKGSKEFKRMSKELDAAKLRHAANAKKLVNAVNKVTGTLSWWKRKLSNVKAVFRHSMGASAVRDWLFHSTLRNAARITKGAEELAALHFVLGIVADLYDYTDTSTGEFTNGIDMKPFLLLGGDSLEDVDGQDADNVVNYGMWMLWAGDSGFPEDDDAAYLEAMDFAQKFHQDLVETQEEENRHACNVDIYVVRPIIRNPDTDHQALYWLIMNDIPWSTAD